MSIIVKNLTKIYGTQRAIDNISFEVKKGEIAGFIGPNGAGKSTTMKIITGYIPPTYGKAFVNNMDIFKHSLEIRRQIGYLPENNPLYTDMYVKEFLNFVAGIYKIKNRKQRIAEIIELTGLEREQNKKIGQLSKGYKQRVGLAQALIHNPSVLILDEPTSGLDPNQIIEIRNLIKRLGSEKTVLLSTHIMQEVEAICDRIIIINKGKIVANEKSENINKTTEDNFVFLIEFDSKIDKAQLMEISPQITNIKAIRETKFIIVSNQDIRKQIFEFAVKNKTAVLSLQKQEKSLEEIFRELTAK